MTRADAIAAKCKECIYDPDEDGTWRQQVRACDIESCALYPIRPKSLCYLIPPNGVALTELVIGVKG